MSFAELPPEGTAGSKHPWQVGPSRAGRAGAAETRCHPGAQHLERNICHLSPSLSIEETEAHEVKHLLQAAKGRWDLASGGRVWRLQVLSPLFTWCLLPRGEDGHFKVRSAHSVRGRQKGGGGKGPL